MNKYFLILPTFSVFHGIASVIVMYPPCTFVARPHPFKIFSFPFLPSPHVDPFQFNGIVTIPLDSMLLYRPVVLTRPFNTQPVDIVAHTILPVLPISKSGHLNLINTTLLVLKRALSASQISQRMWLSEYNFTSKIVRLGFNSHWVRKHEYQTPYLHALSVASYLRKVGSHGGGMKIGSLVFMQNSISSKNDGRTVPHTVRPSLFDRIAFCCTTREIHMDRDKHMKLTQPLVPRGSEIGTMTSGDSYKHPLLHSVSVRLCFFTSHLSLPRTAPSRALLGRLTRNVKNCIS